MYYQGCHFFWNPNLLYYTYYTYYIPLQPTICPSLPYIEPLLGTYIAHKHTTLLILTDISLSVGVNTSGSLYLVPCTIIIVRWRVGEGGGGWGVERITGNRFINICTHNDYLSNFFSVEH